MISFVYFDLGGVVIKDLVAASGGWEKMKRGLGVIPAQDEEFDEYYDKIELAAQSGTDIDTFLPEMAQKFNLTFPVDYSIVADLVQRFAKNESIWPVIDQAKKHWKIGLLTNTYPGLLNGIRAAGLLPSMEWDVIVDSSVEGAQKPERKIYDIATARAGVPENEIIFIDDREKNIAGAKAVTWQTFLYDPNNVEKSNEELTNLLHLSGQ